MKQHQVSLPVVIVAALAAIAILLLTLSSTTVQLPTTNQAGHSYGTNIPTPDKNSCEDGCSLAANNGASGDAYDACVANCGAKYPTPVTCGSPATTTCGQTVSGGSTCTAKGTKCDNYAACTASGCCGGLGAAPCASGACGPALTNYNGKCSDCSPDGTETWDETLCCSQQIDNDGYCVNNGVSGTAAGQPATPPCGGLGQNVCTTSPACTAVWTTASDGKCVSCGGFNGIPCATGTTCVGSYVVVNGVCGRGCADVGETVFRNECCSGLIEDPTTHACLVNGNSPY